MKLEKGKSELTVGDPVTWYVKYFGELLIYLKLEVTLDCDVIK